MIALIDFDSVVYASCYKIVDIAKIRSWFDAGRSREWMETEILHLAVNRCMSIDIQILEAIEQDGVKIELDKREYFLTPENHNARLSIYPDYKKNRRNTHNPITKWVTLVRQYLCYEMDFAKISDTWEADDLIYDRVQELESDSYIIVSMDKDLKQIPGLHYDIYKIKTGDVDLFGNPAKKYRGFSYVTPTEANYNFWKQVLTGDQADNIKGCKGIGDKKADKILQDRKNLLRAAYEAYIVKYVSKAREEFCKNYFLIKLGTNRK